MDLNSKMSDDDINFHTGKIGKNFLQPLALLQGIFFICLLCSVFVFIWSTWVLALQVSLTGLFGLLICKFLHKVIFEAIKTALVTELKKLDAEPTKRKSKFMQRLEKAIEEAGELKKEKQ